MGLALYPEDALEGVDVQVGFGQQFLELGVVLRGDYHRQLPFAHEMNKSEATNYFFIHGRDPQAQQAHLQALDAAQQGLEGAMQLHDLPAIQRLAQALGGEVHILSHHLCPEGHGPQLERTPRGFRLTYAVLPNPWAIDFSEDGLLQWLRAQQSVHVPSSRTAEPATPAGQV